MLKKLSRYYHTLKHLKPIQIRYQVWYRLRAKFFPVQYPEGVKVPSFQKLKLEPFPEQYTHYLGDNHFQFLNLEQNFKDEINWNYLGHGKLWAYHLNYFDYLHQEKMNWETGKQFIDHFLENPAIRTEGLDPYPISLRNINWIKFLAVHGEYPEHIVNSIFAQYKMLLKKVEYHLLANHLLENAFSLLFGAVFFQDEELIKTARKILKAELDEQILKDGGHFELSPMYHIILLQRALDCYNLLSNNNHQLQDVEQKLKAKTQEMVNWLNTITFSNGDIPMFNDSVEGQAIRAETILKYASRLGFEMGKTELSDSGYRKRNWGDFELVMDVGNIKPDYQPGHAHADALSFVLYHEGEPVIVDRGISTYEPNELRKAERSTLSHNTVVINDENQSDVWGAFRVGKRAKVKLLKDEPEIVEASIMRGSMPHTRSWICKNNILIVKDSVDSLSEKSVTYVQIHFHPGYKLGQISNNQFRIKNLKINIEGAAATNIEKYKWCGGFNDQVESTKLRALFNGRIKTTIEYENPVPD